MYKSLWGANHFTDSVIGPPQCHTLHQLVWYVIMQSRYVYCVWIEHWKGRAVWFYIAGFLICNMLEKFNELPILRIKNEACILH